MSSVSAGLGHATTKISIDAVAFQSEADMGKKAMDRLLIEGNESAGPEWGRLIEAVATRRDRVAFVALYEHFAPRVKTFMLRSGASDAEAEDLAQETILTVWRKADSFVPGKVGAASWIFTIARNLRTNALRHEPRKPYVVGPTMPELQVEAGQLEECVRKATAQLTDEEMRVIELSFFEEKAHGEIRMQIPLGAVKSLLRRALARLHTVLGEMS